MRILVVTSSRADFGLLAPVIKNLKQDDFFDVAICEIGNHISESSENLQILREVGLGDLTLSINTNLQDTPMSKAELASAILGNLTSFFSQESTDAVLILGDRYETLAIAYASSLSNIPIIHLVGGDLTVGSIDDNYRHAITKLAKVHLVTNATSYNRVLQLGEEPEFVKVCGSPGLDSLVEIEFRTKPFLEDLLGLNFQSQIILVTFHPDSINPEETEEQVKELINALEHFHHNSTIILTGSNYDSGYTTINKKFEEFSAAHPSSVKFIGNLGTRNYLSMMKIASIMVGNSSSGYYEAPSFGLPVVDLGNRQRGRTAHALLFNAPVNTTEIVKQMNLAMAQEHSDVVNPYGDGKSAQIINQFLKSLSVERIRSPKGFVSISPKEHK